MAPMGVIGVIGGPAPAAAAIEPAAAAPMKELKPAGGNPAAAEAA